MCMSKSKRIRKSKKYDHSLCEMLVAPKGPHIGLWCAQHHKYIKWLNPKEQREIKNMDVIWLNSTPDWIK